MEYAKDEVFNIRYNRLKGTLEYGTKNKKKIKKLIKQYKFVIILGIVAIGLSAVNIMMIISFVKTLTQIC